MKGGLTLWDPVTRRHRDVGETNPVPVALAGDGFPVSASGTIEVAESTVELELGGRGSVGVRLYDEMFSFNGTITAEVSLDGGASWFGVPFVTLLLDGSYGELVSNGVTNAVFSFEAHYAIPVVAGATHARVRMANVSSVPVAVTLSATHAVPQLTPVVPIHSSRAPRLEGYGLNVSTIQALPALAVTRGGLATTEPAYSAGDCIGGEVQFAPAITSGAPVILRALTLKDDKNAKPDLQLLFFRTNPGGTYADNAAVVVTTADLGELVGMVSVAAAEWKTIQGQTKAAVAVSLPNGGIPCGPAASALWMVVLAVSTPDYGANSTDLTYETVWEQGA